MTTQEWAKLAARMIAWWPATKWSQEMVAVWYEDLREFDVAVVATALEVRKRERNDFAPSIGTVLGTVEDLLYPEAPPWPEAWLRIKRAMSKCRWDEVATVEMLAREHEALGQFVATHTVRVLAHERTEDPDYGGAILKRLSDSYVDIARRVRTAGQQGRALESVRRRAELGGAQGPQSISDLVKLQLPQGAQA